jgi:tetratricopeptide (TPR) repeat protein
MTTTIRQGTILFVLLAACATTGATAVAAPPQQRYKQADFRFPPEEKDFEEDAERGHIKLVILHLMRAQEAREAGAMDQARTEYREAADQMAEFADKFPSIEWRIPLRYNAAQFYQFAQLADRSAEQAEKVLVDPMANQVSKAMASRVAAMSWLSVGFAKAKAGTLDKIALPTAEQRRDRPLAPRVPPGEWKRFVEAADVYAASAASDPEGSKPGGAHAAGDLVLRTAQIEYAFDDMEDARGRFDKVIAGWPGDAELMEAAVPLYLQTFAVLKDDAGLAAAVGRVKATLSEQVTKATDPKAKEALAKVLDLVARQEEAAAFAEAQRLLEGGKATEAGAAFERIAARGGAAAPVALFNGAVAYDKAGQADKATALREQLVRDFPDAKLASTAQLSVAAARARAGKNEEAVALYQAWLAKNQDGTSRCSAVQNLGVAYEQLKKPLDAAAQYLALGSDAACVAEDANNAAKLAFRAGELFAKGKKKPEAKQAYAQVVGLSGKVTDVVAKSLVVEAKKRLKGL